MTQDQFHNNLTESGELNNWNNSSPTDAEHALLAELRNLSPFRLHVQRGGHEN